VRIQTAIPEDEVSKPILDASLEAVTRLNEALIKSGKIPTFRSAVDRVRWQPEPPGQEHFDHGGIVLGRGWGDCDDLGPWHAASLRATGEDRGARSVVKRSGPKRWHAVVERSNGTIDDPSREAGMGQSVSGCGAACVSPIVSGAEVGAFIALPRLAVRGHRENPASSEIEAWQARAELPWNWSPTDSPTDVAMVSLHSSPVASQRVAGAVNGYYDSGFADAVVGALHGAIRLGAASGYADPQVLDVAEAMKLAALGVPYEELAQKYGPAVASIAHGQVVGIFKKAAKKLLKPAKKILKSKPVKFAAPIVAPGAYVLAKGAEGALSRKGSIVQKAKGFGSGAAKGYTDRVSNPVFKTAASAFGMKGVATSLEKGSKLVSKGLAKGGKPLDVAKGATKGAAALSQSFGGKVKIKAVNLPKVKVPKVKIKAVSLPKIPKVQIRPVSLPKGAVTATLKAAGVVKLKSGAECDPSKAICYFPGR
jgi:hypothetical protein